MHPQTHACQIIEVKQNFEGVYFVISKHYNKYTILVEIIRLMRYLIQLLNVENGRL